MSKHNSFILGMDANCLYQKELVRVTTKDLPKLNTREGEYE